MFVKIIAQTKGLTSEKTVAIAEGVPHPGSCIRLDRGLPLPPPRAEVNLRRAGQGDDRPGGGR
jgi:hypothetical protein